jgi:hypothetical protein
MNQRADTFILVPSGTQLGDAALKANLISVSNIQLNILS